ncbi:hypothetical protein HGO75_21840 [Mycobacterium tuberculosis]|nr:hypothetical protein [Mycobacterium tuberculosis]
MPRLEIPNGWCVQAFRFTLDPTAEPIRRDEGRSEGVRRPPPAGRNGQQATNYQH